MCCPPRDSAPPSWWPEGHAADPPGEHPQPTYTIFFTYEATELDEESAAWIAENVVDPDGEAELRSSDPREPRRWLVLRGAVLYEFTASPVYA
jgi:hypothetical protein